MKAPMILPWLAKKWGVSQTRTLELWKHACQEADEAIGKEKTSAYWKFAKERWIDLLDHEVLGRYPAAETPWIMIHLNLLRMVASIRVFVGARLPRLGNSY